MKLVEKRVHIAAPPAVLYELLTQPEHFVRWMADQAEIDARPGGTIRWVLRNGDAVAGSFVELVPDRRIVFSYGWERADVEIPPGSTTVEIDLVPDGGGTELRLVHRGLAGGMADAHSGGWEHYLARLAAAATGDGPGPDPWADRRVPTPAEMGEPSAAEAGER